MQRLKRFGVKLAANKCKFFMDELNFLGYHISASGFRPEKDQLKVIRDMEPPTSVKEIRQCLGFFNFYKFFVPNFSLYAG